MFKKYQHIDRLNTVNTDGILNGECYITSKIDGTNGSVWYDDSIGLIECGSRNHILDSSNTNQGFWNYINQDELIKFSKFFKEYPYLRLFGEWLVPHTFKAYKESAWNEFYVFDVIYNDKYLTYLEYMTILSKYNISYIPLIIIKENPSIEFLVKEVLPKANFLLEDENGIGEGIVIKNYNFVNKFGRPQWGKIVTSEFQEQREVTPKKLPVDHPIEVGIVTNYITQSLVDKEYAKIVSDADGWQSVFIPRLLQTIYHCLIEEETWNILQKFKSPTINFNWLQAETYRKIKELRKDLF